MKKVVFNVVVGMLLFSTLVVAQPGQLDNSFAEDGKFVFDFMPDGISLLNCIAIQQDGKTILGGTVAGADNNNDFGLVRLNLNGTFDSTFSADGIVISEIGSTYDHLSALTLQPDGKILGGGTSRGADGVIRFTTVRYKTDGSLDATFGTGGVVKTKIGDFDWIYSIMVRPDGKVLVAGRTEFGGDDALGFVQYNSNGTLDLTFSGDGKFIHSFAQHNALFKEAALLPDGNIIVTSRYCLVSSGANCDYMITKYNAHGNPDTTFGVGGMVLNKFSESLSSAAPEAFAIQSDGKMLLGAGQTFSSPNLIITRHNPDGSLDSTFANNGKIKTPSPQTSAFLAAIAVQADGKILAAGTSGGGGEDYVLLARYTPNGILDSVFGQNGIQTTSIYPGASGDFGKALAIQPDGKPVVAAGANLEFAAIRYLIDLNVGVVDFNAPISSTLVYPNPIAETATLQYSLTRAETVSIQLFDKQGKLISILQSPQLQEAGDHSVQISLPAGLPAGSYVLSIQSATGRVAVQVVR